MELHINMNEIIKGVFKSWVLNKYSAQAYLDVLWNNIRQYNEKEIKFDNYLNSDNMYINDDLRIEKLIAVNKKEKNKEYYMNLMMNIIYDNKSKIPLEIGITCKNDKEYIYSIFVEESVIPYIIFAENNNIDVFFKKTIPGVVILDKSTEKEKYKRDSLKVYKMNVLNDIYFNW